MTISARLSRTLHVAFGEDGADDMTAWMNTVDDHRSELREMHDLAMSRIDARFDANEARFDAKLDRMESRFDAKLDRLRAELIKWAFVFWCGTIGVSFLIR